MSRKELTRFAMAVFSDDVRHEMGNKHSIVGSYINEIFLPSFPMVIPRLCATIFLATGAKDPFTSISVKIHVNGNVVSEMVISEENMHMFMGDSKPESATKRLSLQLMAVMSPIPVDAPGRMEVTVKADGKRLMCNGLDILQAPPGSFA